LTNGDVELEHKDLSVKGWNWGKIDVRGQSERDEGFEMWKFAVY